MIRALINPEDIKAGESKVSMPIKRSCGPESKRQIYKLMFIMFMMKASRKHKAVENKRGESFNSFSEGLLLTLLPEDLLSACEEGYILTLLPSEEGVRIAKVKSSALHQGQVH